MAGGLKDLTEKANALKSAGRLKEAIAAYEAIAALAPGNGAVIHNLAGALGDAGRNREAVERARAALATGLDAPETWHVLARALVGAGRYEEGERAFGECLRRRPADSTAHKELAQLRWMLSAESAKALSEVERAIRSQPDAINLKLVRAQILGQTGDPAAEYQAVLDVLRSGPRAPYLEMAASNSALAAGEPEAALAHARAANTLLADDPAIEQALARALLATGEPLEASCIAGRLRARFPLDQSFIALQATAWRILGDERRHRLDDFERFVWAAPLSRPSDWPSAEAYVDDLIAALDRRHDYATHPFGQSVRHGGQLSSIDTMEDPALQAVPEALAGPVRDYIERLGAGSDPLRARNRGGHSLFSVWSVKLKSSGYHVNHVHPQGWLSSACHLRFTENPNADDRSGWIKFGEPGIPTKPALAAEKFIKPRKGVIVIFPSYMWHGTVPFSGEASRLTIAADFSPAAGKI